MSQTGSHSNAIETTKSKSNSGKRHETEELVGHMLGQFIIDDYVTGGSFGSFHYGHDSRNNDKVAIKLEKKGVPQPQLHLEFGFYRSLGLIRFIPKIYYFGICGNQVWHGMVMELLGPSLLAMNDKCGGTFTTATTVQLTIQLLNVFEYVHDHGLLYRDIKPENFLFGLPNSDKWCTVCLIDLGFCKRYVDEHNCHIEYKKGKPITGTARYISVNNHGGCELSRRDDMEALIYMIVFLHKGHLPWQGLNAQSMGIKERYRQMGIYFILFYFDIFNFV
ncbi:hypothetical protein RDWZM_007827 [Blomia tropicalis]|uniref:non-specific serine/threonine protein kinase n=1 Tax=Blomia tropicalis TaxID=40697 RepID=A0A9Q0RJS9_BLOTA|nr:hypothetical protein RDWZM_007827 [Blomia tropicalis]